MQGLGPQGLAPSRKRAAVGEDNAPVPRLGRMGGPDGDEAAAEEDAPARRRQDRSKDGGDRRGSDDEGDGGRGGVKRRLR